MISFAYPWLLSALPLALFALRRRVFAAIPVSGLAAWRDVPASRRLRWLSRLPVVRSVALALLIVAAAGPQAERRVGEEVKQGIAIELLVDISSSMEQALASAGPVRSRLTCAREVLESFIRHRPDDLIGVITFARYADTLSPLTLGHDALVEIVRGLDIEDRQNEDGTAYGDALALACARLRQQGDWQSRNAVTADELIRSKIVILLTDGENNCGRHLPEEAAGLAKKWGVRVYAISMAERGGAAPVQDLIDLTDPEKLLRWLTAETGGAYWKIANETELAQVYERINNLEKSEIHNTLLYHTERVPLFAFLVIPALVLLLLDVMLCATVLRVAEEEDEPA